MNKKDIYNASTEDLRTYVGDELAIKPYYYIRNGLLHVRYTVDRCVALTKDEADKLKDDISKSPEKKQEILESNFKLYTKFVGKPIIKNGLLEVEKRIKQWTAE